MESKSHGWNGEQCPQQNSVVLLYPPTTFVASEVYHCHYPCEMKEEEEQQFEVEKEGFRSAALTSRPQCRK